MIDHQAMIDAIVREVIARLGASAPAVAPVATSPAAASPAAAKSGCGCDGKKAAAPQAAATSCSCGCKTEGVLRVTSRLVTLADLPAKLEGLKQVIVPAQAVVTPAVRDALKPLRISLAYALKTAPAGKAPPPIVMAVTETTYCPAGLSRALSLDGATVERLPQSDLPAATDALASAIRSQGALGLVLCDQTATALCVANRAAGVRAVTANDTAELRRAAWATGANVLCLPPRRLGFFLLKRLASQFALEAPYFVPASYARVLE